MQITEFFFEFLTKLQPNLRRRSEAFAPHLPNICNIRERGAIVLLHNAENGRYFPAADDADQAFSVASGIVAVGGKAGDAAFHSLHNLGGDPITFRRNNGDRFGNIATNEEKIRYFGTDV